MHRNAFRSFLFLLGAALLLFLPNPKSYANEKNSTTYWIKSRDGTKLYVEESGSKEGPPILFIHGFAQSRRVWKKQIDSPKLQNFRLITFDIRGHGNSDKPEKGYQKSLYWAEDIQSIIDTLHLKNVILVGWSYGGLIICDYIRYFSDNKIGGIHLVGACTNYEIPIETTLSYKNEYFQLEHLASLNSEEMVRSTSLFTRLLTYKKLDDSEFCFFMGGSMMVPTYVRRGLMTRTINNNDLLVTITKPTLASFGVHDPVVPHESQPLSLIKTLKLSLYNECGHAIFWENPDRFNVELEAFAHHCQN